MDEYLCLTVQSRVSEPEGDFKARLSAFWTHMLRAHPDDFEKVYAETVAFEPFGGRLARKYLIEAEVADALTKQLKAQGVDHAAIDTDDLYSKFEAAPPDWMWIEH